MSNAQHTSTKVGRKATGRRPKCVIRLHQEIRDAIEQEALRQERRVGTLVSLMVSEELRIYKQVGDNYQLSERVDTYELTHGHYKQAAPQMSIYITQEEKDLLENICTETGDRVALVLTGMILNNLVRNNVL